MKCVHCGMELKEGSLFCSHCGKEVQIVPDYNVYDEDYLKQVLEEENRPTDPAMQNVNPGQKRHSADQKKKNRIYITICVSVVAVVAIMIAVMVTVGLRNQHANSFDYQVQMAEEAYDQGDINAAIEYYENALALDNDNIDVRLRLASIYMDRKDYDSALILAQEVINMDNKNKKACEMLISIYENQKNYDAIIALCDVVDDSLWEMFSDYVVTPPVFSVEAGEYDEFITLELSTTENYSIYYSMDGSDPILRGSRYTSPIELDENLKSYTISAVCMNEKGIYSEVISNEYSIDIPAPSMPIVTPDGGDFGVETTVTVTVPDGCSAYYTWDGSDPNMYSMCYSQPIPIQEGNNVLSVILVDNRTGLFSDIYRGNFIYYVEDYEEESLDTPEIEEW